jgi:hypothetical protein
MQDEMFTAAVAEVKKTYNECLKMGAEAFLRHIQERKDIIPQL